MLVRRTLRLTKTELTDVVGVLLSSEGNVSSLLDGVVIVSDTVEVLAKVAEMLDRVEAAESVTWLVQLHYVTGNRRAFREMGFDAVPALELATGLSLASATAGTSAVGSSTALQRFVASLRAAEERRYLTSVAEPLFVLVDGADGKYVRGQRVPVPLRSVSNQGTVQTLQFQQVQTGLEFSVTARELGDGKARCIVKVQDSSIERFVESSPLVQVEEFNATVDVASGGVYLVGALRRRNAGKGGQVGLKVLGDVTKEEQQGQVWLRAVRIAGGVGDGGGVQKPPESPTIMMMP